MRLSRLKSINYSLLYLLPSTRDGVIKLYMRSGFDHSRELLGGFGHEEDKGWNVETLWGMENEQGTWGTWYIQCTSSKR